MENNIFSKTVFWTALSVVIIGNILISLVLVPFLVVLNRWFLDFIIVVLAGVMGFLYNFLINDIEHLERKHHILAGGSIALIGVVNIFFVVAIANKLAASMKIKNMHNPYLIGGLFVAAFILPYIIDQIRKRS